MRVAPGSAPAGETDEQERARKLVLGRIAGYLFLAGAVASAPANQLLTNPEPGWHMHLINVLALVSGLACILAPWDRLPTAALNVIPVVATAEIVLTVSALGVHGEIYLWYFVLGAVFTGYAFRNRWQIAAHMAVSGLGFLSTAVFSFGWDQDALVRALVAVPTLWVAAGVVTALREGLEARERVARALFEEREREARTDSLTGLANRRALIQALEVTAQDAAAPHTLALFDLDGFKLFNDRFGHPAGDALLQRLSEQLRRTIGDAGEAYRLGGDEFCVLIRGTGEAAQAMVSACSDALGERGQDFAIAASWGAAAMPDEADTPYAALSTADRRMYVVKEQHRREHAAQAQEVQAALLARHERRGGSRARRLERDAAEAFTAVISESVRIRESAPESAPAPPRRRES